MHGGKRKGAGRKHKPKIESAAPQISLSKPGNVSTRDREAAGRVLEALNRQPKEEDSYEVQQWRLLAEAQDLRIRLDTRKFLYDKRDGKATQPISGDVDGAPIQFEHTIKFGNGTDPHKP